MTCEELHRFVQDLSTSYCFVSNFETDGLNRQQPTATIRMPAGACCPAASARPYAKQIGIDESIGRGNPAANGCLAEATAPFSKGGAAAAAGNWKLRSRGPKFCRGKTLGRFDAAKRQEKARSRPISRVLSWTVIPLGAASPRRSSNLPGDTAGRGIASLFGLAPGGVCRAGPLPDSRCALTAPFHPCHAFRRTVRRYLSVALSVGSRRPGVTWHRALWSPDFPRHPSG